MEASEGADPRRIDFIFQVLLTYNNKLVHHSNGFVSSEERTYKNNLTIKPNMEVKAKHGKTYKPIKVRDKVKLFKKKLLVI